MIPILAVQMDHAAPLACTPAAIRAAAPSGWGEPRPTRNGATAAIGRAVTLTLGPVAAAGFLAAPAKPVAMGAAVAVVVPRAGRWRVSLDAGVWIDLVGADRRAVTSIAHAHGAACSGVRKTVDFDLAPGRYFVQLSAATAQEVPVMVAPAG
jgi:hypothetical protein